MSWTPERTQRAIELYTQGYSASQIAQDLGGVTRNAVIGKIHRMGAARKNKGGTATLPAKTGARAKPVAVRSIKTKPAPRRPKPKPIKTTIPKRELKRRSFRDEGPLKLTDLGAGTCRFPVTEHGPEHAFCGAKSMEGSPYCEQHHALCHEQARKRNKNPGGRFLFQPQWRAA